VHHNSVIKLAVTPQVQSIIREYIVKILYTLVVFKKQQYYTVCTYFSNKPIKIKHLVFCDIKIDLVLTGNL
jgi:hypothetical protein